MVPKTGTPPRALMHGNKSRPAMSKPATTQSQSPFASPTSTLLLTLLVLGIADVGTGCRRRKPAVPPSSTPPASQPADSGPSSSIPAASGTPSGASSQSPSTLEELESELARITDAAQTYGSVKGAGRRVVIPASVEELVKGGFLIPAPVAPPGKRFIINQRTGQAEAVNR